MHDQLSENVLGFTHQRFEMGLFQRLRARSDKYPHAPKWGARPLHAGLAHEVPISLSCDLKHRKGLRLKMSREFP